MNRFFIALFLSVCVFAQSTHTAFAAAPEGYYDNADGKSGYTLKTALHNIIKAGHQVVSYDRLWTAYKDTDIKPGTSNKVWDMYSNCDWTLGSDQCGNVSSQECHCYNREHSMPKSWFNEAKPMYSDIVHLVPTDGQVNGRRSNHPFGEVGSATWTSKNGSKVGNSNFSGYSGVVFEPIDEYKGDFARIYFYMATRYEDVVSGWSSDMLGNDKTQVFTTWAKNLLLKWHRQDPVSEKERARNDGIEKTQNNRNPFVDHPRLAEKIWGDDSTPFFLDGSDTVGVEVDIEQSFIEDEVISADMYPTVEIISVSGVRLKSVSFSEVNTTLEGLACGVYIIRYIHKNRHSFISRKIVK